MAFLVLSSIMELDRINLLKAVTSISEIKIFLNRDIKNEIKMELRLKEIIFPVSGSELQVKYCPRAPAKTCSKYHKSKLFPKSEHTI